MVTDLFKRKLFV